MSAWHDTAKMYLGYITNTRRFSSLVIRMNIEIINHLDVDVGMDIDVGVDVPVVMVLGVVEAVINKIPPTLKGSLTIRNGQQMRGNPREVRWLKGVKVLVVVVV